MSALNEHGKRHPSCYTNASKQVPPDKSHFVVNMSAKFIECTSCHKKEKILDSFQLSEQSRKIIQDFKKKHHKCHSCVS